MNPESTHDSRKVYAVSAFNRGVASWLSRLPSVWVEGEVTELRRQERWQSVFFTLKDPGDGSCLAVSMPRAGFDGLGLELADGARVQVYGRPELVRSRATFRLRALTVEEVGLGAILAGLERLKRKLAAEGLLAPERKRSLPVLPSRIGFLTGSDAAAKLDFLTAVHARFPAARILVAETAVQGPHAAEEIVATLAALAREPEVEVIVVARGGGGFEDLLPFSSERVVRAIARCPIPVVTAVGHEQDTPLCDLVADARASTPTAAARLVVPDERALRQQLEHQRLSLSRDARGLVARARERVETDGRALAHAPLALLSRKRAATDALAASLRALSPRATLERGYAIVRAKAQIVRSASSLAPGDLLELELASGGVSAETVGVRP